MPAPICCSWANTKIQFSHRLVSWPHIQPVYELVVFDPELLRQGKMYRVVYTPKISNEVGTEDTELGVALRWCCDDMGTKKFAEMGVGCGTIPESIQSSWNTTVIPTRSRGRLADGDEAVVRGRVRTWATFITSIQAMRRVESTCHWRVHLKRSGRGLSACLSMEVSLV